MEIRALAEQVLFGERLEDKLLRPATLSDARPGAAIRRPDAPGRPTGLAPVRRARIPFPTEAQLDDDAVRGAVLHRFANHELMAIELMALALLRFPDAPRAFRRGIVGALFEEQEHFSLYLERMQALGCALGEVPSSPMFWDMLSPMSDPQDYVVGMSLTFEQANLDFARHYRGVFARVGDRATADVLNRVYEDEIGHVKLGLVWFRRWKDDAADDWSAWSGALPDRLQPSRARGIGFDVEGRRRAGFDEDFIRRLRVFRQSKGRVPALHRFNPTAEIELAGRTPPKVARRLTRDLETLPMFVCARDDAVLVSRPPRPAFLEPLARAGFVLPEFVTADEVEGRRFSAVEPWAATVRGLALDGAQLEQARAPTPAALFGKEWSAAQLAECGPTLPLPVDPRHVGVACADRAAVAAQVGRLRAAGFDAIVAKASLSTAGGGIRRLHGMPSEMAYNTVAGSAPAMGSSSDPAGSRGSSKWLDRWLSAGPIIVEPWLDRVLDLGIQLTVRGPDDVRIDGITRNLVDTRGRHRGILLTPLATGLPVALRIFLMSRPVQATLRAVGDTIGRALAAAGHRGPAAIDALVHRGGDGYGLKPLVEVNPRCSMGRIALNLRKRVARGCVAAWLQLPAAQAPTAAAFESRGRPPLITGGVLPTSDAHGARFATTLFVAANLDGLRAQLAPYLDDDGPVDPALRPEPITCPSAP